MPKPTTIYLLTSGQYSDYSVDAAFTTRAEAERAAELHEKDKRWGDARVEEYVLYDRCPDFTTVYKVGVRLYEDGTTDMDEDVRTHLPWNHFDGPHLNGRPKVSSGRWFSSTTHPKKNIYISGYGSTLESTRKAVFDRVAQEKAKLAGI